MAKLSSMSDEEIHAFMGSIPTDDWNTDNEDEAGAEAAAGHLCQRYSVANLSVSHKYAEDMDFEEEDGGPVGPTCIFDGVVKDIRHAMSDLLAIIWKRRNLQLHVNELVFRGQQQLPDYLAGLKTPYDCFMYFLNENFIKDLVEQMNLYAKKKNISVKFKTDCEELTKFLGILVFTSVFRFPHVRELWGKYGLEPIRKAMPVERFEELERYLHFKNDTRLRQNRDSACDPLVKVRPLIQHFNKRFGTIPMPQRLCVQEQMCITKSVDKSAFMPAKREEWRPRMFGLCDSHGFLYAFEIYGGAADNVVAENQPNLDVVSNVVVRLSQHIQDNVNHIVYVDEIFTSLALVVYLRGRGIHSLGKVRPQRVPNIKLSSDEILVACDTQRGYAEEYVGTVFGIDISNVLWCDRRSVRFLSSYVGTESIESENDPLHQMSAETMENYCPAIINEFNKHIGAVEFIDSLLDQYHICTDSKKWSTRLFYHLIDMAMVNAFVLYHRLQQENVKSLPDFRLEIAERLCGITTTAEPLRRGRSVSSILKRSERPVGQTKSKKKK